jgi:hypothetical protein
VRSGGDAAAGEVAALLVASVRRSSGGGGGRGSDGSNSNSSSSSSSFGRLRSLAVADALFVRSRAFRAALCSRLPEFLEGAAPVAAGASRKSVSSSASSAPRDQNPLLLDEASLETLTRWDAAHGANYPEVRAATRWLGREVEAARLREAARAAAAGAEGRARADRRRSLARERISRVLVAGGELCRVRAEAEEALQQTDEALALLERDGSEGGRAAFAAAAAAAAAAGREEVAGRGASAAAAAAAEAEKKNNNDEDAEKDGVPSFAEWCADRRELRHLLSTLSFEQV